MVQTPVLLIAFNRPHQTKRLIDSIVKSGATNVFVAVDGPRDCHPQDKEEIAEIKRLIDTAPWPGEVTTLVRTENLGCRQGVSGAISWFFSHVEEGIIFEDDCLPDTTFFKYAEELLELYRDNERIGMISGSTYFPLPDEASESYTFSQYPAIWGWATWKRAWAKYDTALESWGTTNSLNTLATVSGGSRNFVRHWKKLLDKVKAGNVDTWDYIWCYSFWRSGFLSVSPGQNLIENIGYSGEATHAKSEPLVKSFKPKASSVTSPLRHPELVHANESLDRLVRNLGMGVHGKRIRSFARLVYGARRFL